MAVACVRNRCANEPGGDHRGSALEEIMAVLQCIVEVEFAYGRVLIHCSCVGYTLGTNSCLQARASGRAAVV